MRKIIQHTETNEALTILCDDGTLWYATGTNETFKWTQYPPIPQPDAPAPVARPISDKMVRDALSAFYEDRPKLWSSVLLDRMRATLEAADAAREA